MEAEDELSRQLSAWEAEGALQRAMWSDAESTSTGGLGYDAAAPGTSISIGAHGCHPTASLHNLTFIGNSEDIYQTVDNDADIYATFSGWPPKHSHYEELSTAHEEAGVFITKEVAEEEQSNDTLPAEGKSDSADDKDSIPDAADSVKGRAVTGPRVALNQGMRRLLDRANNTRSAMRRGVRRMREIVGIAYRHARHNTALPTDKLQIMLLGNTSDSIAKLTRYFIGAIARHIQPLAGGDEFCEPLLEDDTYTEQEDSGRRSLREFLEADKRLFR